MSCIACRWNWLLPVLFFAFGLVSGPAARADDPRLAAHVLNRLAFGPSAKDLADIQRLGVNRWINRQLNPDHIPEADTVTDRLADLDTQGLDPVALFQEYGPPLPSPGNPPDKRAVKAARERARIIVRQATEARLIRAIWSSRQLQEVMVDFWDNHFNVFAEKGLDHLWVGSFENEAIRPHALGRFRDLLEATARQPAMLFYLDNWQNTAPGSPGAHGKQTGLNENYAREIMELHTLGVNGGYSQDDVIALARILTGWGLAKPRHITDRSGFLFDPDRHDFGDKVFLGRTIHGSGEDEGEEALDILAASPATARHLSFQLAQYFVSDAPPKALVDRLTRRWIATDGDISAVLKTLFFSREFRDPRNFGMKFKTPFEFVASSIRATAVNVVNFQPLAGNLSRLGEPLYGYLTPDGYKNTRDAWLNPDALIMRLGFATNLGSGHMPLMRDPPAMDGIMPTAMVSVPTQPVDPAAMIALLGAVLTTKTLSAVAAAPPPLQAALILGSPEFMQR